MTDFLQHAPGIYFDMPEEDYHGDPALSSHAFKTLLKNPEDWWWNSPFNPNREPEEEKAHLDWGTALHKIVFEGEEAFWQAYAKPISRNDYPDALDTSDDLKAWLKDHDLKVSGKKDDLVARIMEADGSVTFWPKIKAAYEESNAGKKFVGSDMFARLKVAEAHIKGHDQLRAACHGGAAEVSVFWVDAYGLRRKARMDYLKPRAIIDLKTMAPMAGKDFKWNAMRAIMNYRYDMQAANYFEARAAMAPLVADGLVYGDHDADWLRKVAEAEQYTFVFVFQKTTGAPTAKGYTFNRGSFAHGCAARDIEQAIENWCAYVERFGFEPWVNTEELGEIGDEDFPPWFGAD